MAGYVIPTWTSFWQPAILPPAPPPPPPPGPSIIPAVPQDEAPPVRVGPTGVVVDTTCTRCNGKPPAPAIVAGAPLPPTTAARVATPPRYPWWVFILAALTLAQVVKRG